MLGGFTHLLRCFQDYPSIQSFGYIHMGTFLDRESWDGLATFLTHHQPTSVHIEGCNFDEPSDNNLHLNLWPQVTTLSLIDPHGEMSWMTGIGPVFPSVTSLSLSVGELLPVVSRFASLKHLTLTDPHNGTNCMSFLQLICSPVKLTPHHQITPSLNARNWLLSK